MNGREPEVRTAAPYLVVYEDWVCEIVQTHAEARAKVEEAHEATAGNVDTTVVPLATALAAPAMLEALRAIVFHTMSLPASHVAGCVTVQRGDYLRALEAFKAAGGVS